ncbi:MAG: hypothetical protein C0602_05540 [Denitrovibrio sp.]|nr:MAG: hypothetical protein C0602_05540 [Denitrovibrio sp.]
MDRDRSNVNGSGRNESSNCGVVQDIDAAAIFLDTLKAFDEADRLENSCINDDTVAENEESFLPSLENIMEFVSYIRDRMEFLLNLNGLTNDPEFEIDLDTRTGKIITRGSRKDLRKISRLINKDEETRDGLVTLLSIADETYQLLDNLGDDGFPDFTDDLGKVVYLYGDGYLSLYRESVE